MKNKGKEKSELLKKINKNKFIFSTLVHRNKGDLMRDKLISLSKNKNINSYTIPRNKKSKNSYLKNKTIDELSNRHNSIYQKNSIIKKERISSDQLKPRQTYTIGREKNCLKYENINVKNKLNWNIYDNKRYINTENNNFNKTFRESIKTKKCLNYLKLTVSAQNKLVKNKIENKKKHSSGQKRSKTIEKDIKSIKRKYKDKNNNYLIHRNRK